MFVKIARYLAATVMMLSFTLAPATARAASQKETLSLPIFVTILPAKTDRFLKETGLQDKVKLPRAKHMLVKTDKAHDFENREGNVVTLYDRL